MLELVPKGHFIFFGVGRVGDANVTHGFEVWQDGWNDVGLFESGNGQALGCELGNSLRYA